MSGAGVNGSGDLASAGAALAQPVSPGRPIHELPGVEHRWIDAGGLTTHVALAGDPEAPPLLMVHGWPQHWYMWRKLIPGLAEHYRLICPDLRGMGWTAAPEGPYGPRTFAEDLRAVLDAMEIDRTRVISHDWGGFSSCFLAANHPGRVEKLMLLNIPPPWSKVGPRQILSLWRFWYQVAASTPKVSRGLYKLMAMDTPMRRALINGADWSGGAGESFAGQFLEPERDKGAQKLYRRALMVEEPMMTLRRNSEMRVDCPMRIVFGIKDVALHPSLLEGAERQAPRLTVELVPDCGHFIAEEKPEVVLGEAISFFAD